MTAASPVLDRVLAKCDIADCWTFQGSLTADGYGRVNNSTGSGYTHRAVWEVLVGSIPEGLELDHLCLNKACVNPDHLRAVTRTENVRVSETHYAKQMARRTHCKNGHEYTGDNVAVCSRTGTRRCRACHRDFSRKYRKQGGPS